MSAGPDDPDDPRTLPLPARRSGNALPDGTRLAEFEVRATIGEGGFGIVYLAWDHTLHRQVALKEYMPWSLASRTDSTRVTPRSEKLAETFALGLRSFINEAQLLASFDHPSLLKVHRFWESNGTAYMVMPYYQGVTLKRALAGLGAPPEESWLLQQLGRLLDALEVMHRAHCFHRDIAPDNILLLDEGRPLLLDFGAARRVIGDATQALTAFLKPGYAPVEQYAEMPQMKQGAWTDLYALGSVLHYAITGHTPPESVARLVTDTMEPLSRVAAGRYSEAFLRAIDHALGVRPQDRPQSVPQMRAELGLERPPARTRKPGDIPTAPQPLDSRPATFDDATVPPAAVSEPTAVPTAEPTRGRVAMPPVPPMRPQPVPATPRRVGLEWAAAVLAVAAATALGWWALTPPRIPGAPSPAASPVAVPAVPEAPAASSPLSVPVADPARRRAAGTASELPKAEAPADGVPPAPAAAAPAAPSETATESRPEPVATPAPSKPPPGQQRPTPRMSSPNPRCTEIIARVSLGESLTAAERALLQGECRK